MFRNHVSFEYVIVWNINRKHKSSVSVSWYKEGGNVLHYSEFTGRSECYWIRAKPCKRRIKIYLLGSLKIDLDPENFIQKTVPSLRLINEKCQPIGIYVTADLLSTPVVSL